jgi:predicted nucleic acid-binding protein
LTVLPRAARLYLIDTSARACADHHPEIGRILARLVSDGAAATCVTADLEAGYSGRDYSDVAEIAKSRRERWRLLPMNEDIARRAREVQVNMAARGHHRAAGVIDLLTAAVAEYYGAVILHYDADFEHIAAVTGQPQMWVVPRGQL